MTAECREQKLLFQAHGSRTVEAAFDGGMIGALLLRELELKQRIVTDFARCFTDHRDSGAVEFSPEQLLKQRIFGLALGYEDLNDHDRLRVDPLLALLCGRAGVTGQDRRCAADRTSTHWMKANQLRMWLSGVAYLLLNEVRRIGLPGTELARAYVGTIRQALCKIGAVVKVSVRRIVVALSSAYPDAELFGLALSRLRAARVFYDGAARTKG